MNNVKGIKIEIRIQNQDMKEIKDSKKENKKVRTVKLETNKQIYTISK